MSENKPGRPSSALHGSWGGASKDRPGWLLGWSDGVWSGHPEAVAEARQMCEFALPVPLTVTGPSVPADAADPHVAWAVANHVLRGRAVWHGEVPELPAEADLPDGVIG